jgi:hypothetical protein
MSNLISNIIKVNNLTEYGKVTSEEEFIAGGGYSLSSSLKKTWRTCVFRLKNRKWQKK